MATSPDSTTATTGTRTGSKLTRLLGNFVLGGALIALVIAVMSLTLARYDIIDKLSGFRGFMILLNPLRVLVLIAIIDIGIALVRKTAISWKAPFGMAISIVLLLVIYTQVIVPGGNAPRLHDITTDVDDPPQFATLSLREDNLIPFNNIEEWRAAHREGYPDIAPIVIDKSPAEVLAAARALAESKGWTIASVDEESGHMEATAYAGYIRFMDDVIVEVTPIADGSTRVDMRSVSRVGLSDLGYNAARIREFLADLQAV